MALKKEIIFDNGVNINYHYINDVSIDNKNKEVKLKLVSYTNEEYRLREKENKKNKDKYEILINKILEENKKVNPNTKSVIKCSDEANKLIDTFVEDLDLSVITRNLTFNNVTNYDLCNLYTIIKEEDLFNGSEDLI